MKMRFYSKNIRKAMAKSASRLRTSANYYPKPYDNEKPYGESETIPDQDTNLKEIIIRSQQGYAPTQLNGLYTDAEIPDLEIMDEFEIIEYRENLAEKMLDLQEQHHQYSKELEKRHKDKEFQDALAAKIQELQKETPPEGQ